MPIVVCEYCGKQVYKKVKRRFCSIECASKHRQQLDLQRDPDFLSDNSVPGELKYYIIGLIFGDGCLTKQNGKKNRSPSIILALKDRELMEELKSVICPQRKLYLNKGRKEQHSDSYVLITSNSKSIDDG